MPGFTAISYNGFEHGSDETDPIALPDRNHFVQSTSINVETMVFSRFFHC
jgi:hypothetical protein